MRGGDIKLEWEHQFATTPQLAVKHKLKKTLKAGTSRLRAIHKKEEEFEPQSARSHGKKGR